MKSILFASIMLCSISAAAQSKTPPLKPQAVDTSVATALKDTVAVPVFVLEKRDTVAVPGVQYVDHKGYIRYAENAFVIVSRQLATRDGKQYQPLSEPKVIGALDQKRRPLKLPR